MKLYILNPKEIYAESPRSKSCNTSCQRQEDCSVSKKDSTLQEEVPGLSEEIGPERRNATAGELSVVNGNGLTPLPSKSIPAQRNQLIIPLQ